MNRYDWMLFAFRLFINSGAIEKAKAMVARLEATDIDGSTKRDQVIDAIKADLKIDLNQGGLYIARALIELLLSQLRGSK